MISVPPSGAPYPVSHAVRESPETARLRALSVEFESLFLAEMLKNSGLNRPSETMGGGHGEEAFASFLTREYADRLAARGGIGIAEHIFRELSRGVTK